MSKRKFQFLVTLIFSILVSVSAHAEMGIPVQLRLKNASGVYPSDTGVAIKLQVLTPSGGCILREEIFSGQTITDGNISLVLGSGAAGTYNPGLSLNAVYDNSKSKTGLTCVNSSNVVVGSGQTYNPTSIDQRLIRFTATVTGVQLVVDFNMKSIPYAIQAESVGGKVAADIIVNNATSQLNQTNLNNLLLDATRLTNLLDVAQNGNAQSAGSAVNFTGSLTGDVTGTQAATVVARLRGVNISATTPTSGQILVFDGTQYAPASQAAAAVTSVAGRTGAVILTSADIGGLGTAATRNTGVASGNVVQLDSAGKVPTSTLPNNLLTTSSTLAGDVSGNISTTVVNNVGGKTSAQVSQSVDDTIAATSSSTAGTIVKRDGSGNTSLNTITSLNNSTQNVYFYNVSNTNNVRVRAPVTFSDYMLTLPTTDGDLNQVLRTDGAGLLTWVDFPTTGVQSVSATAPLVATGSTNVSLSINVGTSAGTVAAGNDSRISNALQTSAVFGGDVSGTYNNLVLNNSGVTASTYAKVTVDAKGRVTSGTSLIASDIPNLDTNKITSGTFAVARGGTGLSAVGSANQVLGVNAAATGLEYKTITAGSNIMVSNTAGVLTISSSNPGGTVTNVTATAPLSVSNGTTTPSLSISQANASTAGFLTAADWNLFNSKLSTLDLGSVSATGTLAIARLPMFGGDVSSVSGSNVLTLNNSGVAASTYSKVTVDAKGRVTSGSAINSSDVVTALGYTPADAASAGTVLNVSSANAYVNIASATTTPVITLNVGTVSNTVAAGNDSRILGALQQTTFNGYVASASCTSGQSMYWNSVGGNFQCQNILLSGDVSGIASATTVSRILGTSVSVTALANNNILQYNGSAYVNRNVPTCAANEFLTFSGTAWTCAAVSGLGGGTVTNVTSANSYLSVATGTTTPMLTVNVGAVANTLAAGDDTRIVNALQPTTNFSGDVSGTYNNLVLNNSGVTAATYTKVTVDAKGRVTSGTNLVASDIPNLDTNKITSGTFAVARGGTGLSAVGTANQVLGVNAAATGLEYKTITAGTNITVSNTAGVLTISSSNPGGTVTNVTATAPLSVSNGTTTPSLSISQANASTAGFLAAADWNLFNSKLSTLDLGSVSATGTLAIARLPMFGGDVSSVSGSNVLTVAMVGGKTSAQVSQSVSDTIAATSLNAINTIVKRNGSGAFNASSGVFESNVQVKDGAAGGAVTLQTPVGFTSYVLTFPTTDGDPSQVLQTNGSGVLSWMTAAVGSVTNVSSGNSYVTVTNSASTPVITANVGTAANTLAAGDDSRIVNALQTSTVFGGDVSGTYNSIVLNNSGVVAATYTKVTVDAKGRVTSGTSLAASDIPNLDTTKITSGTFAVARGGTGLSAVGTANQVLGVNAAATGLEYKTITAGSNITVSNTAGVLTISSSNPGGTVTNVTATAPLSVSNGTTTPSLSISQANTSTAGFLAAADWNLFNSKLSTLDLGSVSATGTLAIARLPMFGGDVSSVSGSNVLTLNNSGVTASTYSKVTVDVKGRVTSGTSLIASDIPNLDTNKITSGTFAVARGGTGLSAVGTADQVLGVNAAATGLEYKTITAGTNITVSNTAGVLTINSSNPGGTVTNVSSANSYVTVTNGASTPVITANVGAVSGTLAAGNDTRIVNALQPTTVFAGDVSGTASTTSVNRIRGTNVLITTLASNNILQYNGTDYVNRAIPTCSAGQYLFFNGTVWSCVADGGGTVTNVTSGNSFTTITAGTSVPVITVNVGTVSNTVAAGNDSRIVGALQQTTFNGYVAPASCTASQTMYWNSVSSAFNCQSILVSGDVTGNASTTVVTKIQGVAVSSTAPVAGQALVYNGTTWVPVSGLPQYAKLTANYTNAGGITLSDVTGLSFPVTTGKTYKFRFNIVYIASATTRGLVVALTIPAVTTFSALVNIPASTTEGTGYLWSGTMTASGDTVTAAATPSTTLYSVATIEGIIMPTATGIVQLRGALSGVGTLTIKAGSAVEFAELP